MYAASNWLRAPVNAVTPTPDTQRHFVNRHPLLRLLTILGVLAFIFSAIAPMDDDVQPDFSRRSKSEQCTLRQHNGSFRLRNLRFRVIYSVPAASGVHFSRPFVTARIPIPDVESKAGIRCSRAGERSPPTAQS
jgi:hypothetical protein